MGASYDTEKIRTAQDEVIDLNRNSSAIADELTTVVESSIVNQCPGDISNRFKNEVFLPAAKELEEQQENLKKLEDLLGKIADKYDEGTRKLESIF